MADPRTVAPATSILLTLGLICFAEPGFAQQPDSSASAEALKKLSIEQLMNLEVTSVSRRPERLAQAASAIQVITQQDIRRSGASSLPEALRLVTNLQVAQINSRDWAISARGFNSTTANKLLVLIDGRTVYTPLYSGVFWDVQQAGFRLDWAASTINQVTMQGDLYNGRISQATAGDIAVSGGNVVAKWSHTVSANSAVTAQLYYDRTNRNIPGTFGEDLDIYDVDLQHATRLGARHDVVWGLGYRLINDRVVNSALLAFLPPHVTRQWFTGFVQDEIALIPNRLHVALGTKVEHNDYTGYEIQPSGRVSWS